MCRVHHDERKGTYLIDEEEDLDDCDVSVVLNVAVHSWSTESVQLVKEKTVSSQSSVARIEFLCRFLNHWTSLGKQNENGGLTKTHWRFGSSMKFIINMCAE